MSVIAFIQLENNDFLEIRVQGRLDFEKTTELEEKIRLLLEKNIPIASRDFKIIFNLAEMEFVGSSGIGDFFEGLKKFLEKYPHIIITHLKVEFFRVLKIYNWPYWDRIVASHVNLEDSSDDEDDEEFQNLENWEEFSEIPCLLKD